MNMTFRENNADRSFGDYLKIVHQIADARDNLEGGGIDHRGYLKKKDDYCLHFDDGKYYVYLWKHIRGNIFYVGKGHDDRWKHKERGEKFLQHLDKGDCVVYIIADGLKESDALKIEAIVGLSLREAGFDLVNRDKYKYHRMSDDTEECVCRAVADVIRDRDFRISDSFATSNFIKKYGTDYFSSGNFRTWFY